MDNENRHNTKVPTDEQLSAYLSNAASEEDSLLVEHYLKDNPEVVDDLLNMSVATSIQKERNKRTLFLRHRLLYISVAAIFVLLFASIFFLNMFQSDNTTSQYSNQPTKHLQPHSPQQKTATPSLVSDKQKGKANTEKQNPNIFSIQRDEHNTSSIAEVETQSSFTLAWPRRTKEICAVDQPVSFIWNTTAKKIILTIMDNKNNILLSEELLNNNTFTLPTSITTQHSEIRWTMTAFFSDNTNISRSGTIVFINE